MYPNALAAVIFLSDDSLLPLATMVTGSTELCNAGVCRNGSGQRPRSNATGPWVGVNLVVFSGVSFAKARG